ncbi:MAG TPA: hypothetical protein VF331_22165 [Polyangiales bacterium]
MGANDRQSQPDGLPAGRASTQPARTREPGLRHSDVVPKGSAQHLSWREGQRLGLPDETKAVWMQAYEAGFDQAFANLDRGDLLIPLVYAARANDGRLTRALVRFAYELSLRFTDVEAALAVLEVADATLAGRFDKDVCARIASNLIDEAYERFARDRQFDHYFFCHCAAAIARLSAHVESGESARDAIEAIQSAAAAMRVHTDDPDGEVRRLAAYCIRSELQQGSRDPDPGTTPNRA